MFPIKPLVSRQKDRFAVPPAARHINSQPNLLDNDKLFVILRLAYWVLLFCYFVLVSTSVVPMLLPGAFYDVIDTVLAPNYPMIIYILVT